MPHTIAENLTRLVNAKTAIGNAITAKGGTVGANDGLEEFATDIGTIPSGGGGETNKNDVNFYDYDGTIVQSYTASEFANLSALPANPTHTGITAHGWNWTLSDAKTYVASYGKLNVGQMYTTNDGATRIHIRLEDGRLSPYLGLCPDGTLTIDWGDGSATETMTGSSTTLLVYLPHTYAQAGEYVISILPSSGSEFGFGQRSNASSLLCRTTNDDPLSRYVYLNTIYVINIGVGVTSIGQYAFYNCYSLTSITIPSSVTSIGQYAFYNCYPLTSITIPSSVTSIGQYAFSGCYSLASITIPSSVISIGQQAFRNCYSLTSITIPSSVTSISQYAFSGCYSLASIAIPSSVTSIGERAFSGCYSLASITIPSSVTSIGQQAFSGCYSLASITIPSSVTSIGQQAFSGCHGLAYINLNTYEGAIAGAPWAAPSSDTAVNWLKTARFTKSVNEITSGTTLTTNVSCNIGDLIIITFAVRSDTYTISNDWTLLGISEAVAYGQRTGMAYKIAEATTESITVTQTTAERIYTNMVAIQGATLGTFTPFVTQTEGSTITMTRPTGLIVWGVSSATWATQSPYPSWTTSNSNDIVTIQLPNTTQPRCLTALDQSTDGTVSFTVVGDNVGLACGYVTVTGIPNFVY